jgi:hypothetical protein
VTSQVEPEMLPTRPTQMPRASAHASERPSGDHVGLEKRPVAPVTWHGDGGSAGARPFSR